MKASPCRRLMVALGNHRTLGYSVLAVPLKDTHCCTQQNVRRKRCSSGQSSHGASNSKECLTLVCVNDFQQEGPRMINTTRAETAVYNNAISHVGAFAVQPSTTPSIAVICQLWVHTCSHNIFVFAQLSCSFIPAALCPFISGLRVRHWNAKYFPAHNSKPLASYALLHI